MVFITLKEDDIILNYINMQIHIFVINLKMGDAQKQTQSIKFQRKININNISDQCGISEDKVKEILE